ncbi:9668_t:CDS:2, partial [Racocetra persica]
WESINIPIFAHFLIIKPDKSMLTTTVSLTLTSVILLALAIIFNTVHDPLSASIGFSILGCAITWRLVPVLKDSFLKANLVGKDVNKLDKQIIPESMGVICATVYLVCLFLFIPFPFMEWFTGKGIISHTEEFQKPTFPHHK